MIETETETIIETWELILPEDEAGCDAPTCSGPAEWRIAMTPCGHSGILCTPHMETTRSFNERILSTYPRATCPVCRVFVGQPICHRI